MQLRHILFSTTVLFTGACVLSQTAYASPPQAEPNFKQKQDQRIMRVNDAETGTLMFQTDVAGQYIEAPLVATDVKMDIAGPVIRTTLSQTFENTSDQWVEGIYVFPLPENAAVDRLRMVIGGRMIEGQIKEKKQAKKIYQQAKVQGKKASLVEQKRPNIFTASVANIGPHETVAIQIEYQDKVEIKDGVFSAHFPMTVAPRYSPPMQTVQVATTGGLQNVTFDPVLDRKAINPPLNPPSQEPIEYMRLPVSLNINLDAGFDVADVKSTYHDISTTQKEGTGLHVNLAEGAVPANRDFLLEWRAQETREPYSAVFKQTLGNETYLMSMITPPMTHIDDIPTQARESIFVIDTSGSMNGTSIIQARHSLLLALDNLSPKDTFNIIRFSSTHSSFKTQPVPATAQNIGKARRWVKALNANGGTNMSPALAAALKTRSESSGRLRQVIFITDGSIGNEQQLFAQIQDELGEARLFPVGIGSAPNRFFLSRAAKFGRGTSVQIGHASEVGKRMETLFKAINNPVLTDVKSSVGDKYSAARFPSRLPDVYQGDPIISIAKIKTKDLPAEFSISGNRVGELWRETKDLSDAKDATGLSVLWARAKIADLEESRFDRTHASEIDAKILQTALDHSIVSRLTSLVAVDITPSRPAADKLNGTKVPTMLPEGWNFGELAAHNAAQNPTPPQRNKARSTSTTPRSLVLPNTASPHQVLGFLGALLLLLGLGLQTLTRRRAS